MPKLFDFDDFKQCSSPKGQFSNKFVPKYCVLNVKLDKDSTNTKLLRFVKRFSRNTKQHFDHYLGLKRGVCMQNCFDLHERLGEDAKNYKNDDISHVEETGESKTCSD